MPSGRRRRAPTACAWSPRATPRTRAAVPPSARRGTRSCSTRSSTRSRPASRAGSPGAATCPLEYYKDPEKSAATFVTGPTGHAVRPGRRRGDPRGGRHHQPPRARVAVHQLRRREDLPRGGRVRAQGPPGRLRRHRRRRPRRALGPAGGRRRAGPRRRVPLRRRPGRPTAVATLLGTRCRRRSTSCPRWCAPPAASPTTRGPARSPAARSPSEPPDPSTQETSPMQVHEKLFIGGEWVDPAGTDVIEVISPHTEEVVGRGARGHHRRHRPRRRRRPHRLRRGRVAAACRPRSASPSSQRFSDLYAARMMDMAAGHHRPRWARRSASRQLAQSPAPWMMLNSFIAEAPEVRRGRRSAPACSARR